LVLNARPIGKSKRKEGRKPEDLKGIIVKVGS
jgi:hypothetical protein